LAFLKDNLAAEATENEGKGTSPRIEPKGFSPRVEAK
jgi:hypothetical protein